MLCDDDHNYLVLIQGWGWGWYANTWQGPTTIEGNHIHHHLSLLGDGAGIYTLGPEGNLPFASGPQYGPGAVTATCHCFACLRPVSVRSSGLSRACLGESSCFIAYVTYIASKLTNPAPAAAWLAGPTFFANVSAILPPSVIRFNWIHDAGDHESALLDHGGIGEGSHAPGGIYTDE